MLLASLPGNGRLPGCFARLLVSPIGRLVFPGGGREACHASKPLAKGRLENDLRAVETLAPVTQATNCAI
jgi:hypothetical protein